MLSRRSFVKFVLAGSAQAVLPACNFTIPPIRLAAHTWLGYEMFYLAEQFEIMKPSLAELIETPNASSSMRLIASGQVESACLTMDEVLTCNDRGMDLVVVAILDYSVGADVIMVSPSIRNTEQLKDKTIAVESTATGAVMLQSFLEEFNLSLRDVNVEYYSIDEHEELYRKKEADVIVTYDPVKTKLEKLGMVSIFDSSWIPKRIFDVLAVPRSTIKRYKNQLEHLIYCHFDILNKYSENPKEYIIEMSRSMGVSESDVVDAIKGVHLPSLKENKTIMRNNGENIIKDINKLAISMHDAGLIKKISYNQNIINSSCL